jgi:hypothetical protein
MIWKKITGALLVMLITAFVLDRYLNLTRITPPVLKYYNSKYGALNTPNINYMKSREGLFLGTTNYDGRFRENYPKRKTDSNTLRIILIGDSFVEGIDVYGRNHFAAIIEELVSKELNRKVEVLNFGKGNCTLQPSAYYYMDYIKKEYDADLTLFFTEVRDLVSGTDFPSTAYDYDEKTGHLYINDSWTQSTDYKLTQKLDEFHLLKPLNESGFFRLAYRTRGGLEMYGFLPRVFGKFYGEIPPQTYEHSIVNSEMSKSSELVFDTLAKEKSPPVIFVVRNFPFESTFLENYMGLKKYNYISLKDTLDFKIIRNTNDDAYFFKTTGLYGGHWNHLGHKAVGNFLANRIVGIIRNGSIKLTD